MIFPISDDDTKLKRFAWVTLLLLIANVAVYFYQQQNPSFTYGYSAIPKEILTNTDLTETQVIEVKGETKEIPQAPGPTPILLTIFTAMFMHGNLMHIGSNLLFLWIFGDNVENRFGHMRFLLFYIVTGVIASLAHILFDPGSVVPSLGASGAIAGVLGAYLVMFPHNKVNALFFIRIISLPAFLVIGAWGVMQVVSMMMTNQEGGGVAYAAHIGGLVAGMILGLGYRFAIEREPKDNVLYQNYEDDPKARRGLF